MANPKPEAAVNTPAGGDIFNASNYISNLTEAYQNWLNSSRGPDSREQWLAYQEARKVVLNLVIKGLRA